MNPALMCAMCRIIAAHKYEDRLGSLDAGQAIAVCCGRSLCRPHLTIHVTVKHTTEDIEEDA